MNKIKVLILLVLSCLLASACTIGIEFDYNIDFVVDGEVIATVGTNGDKIAMPKNPTKENYTFDGWFWDEGKWNDKFTLNSILDQPLQDKNHYKVYAKFKSSVYYTVTFYYAGEEITQQIKHGEPTALKLNTFEHEDENYVFIGWSDGENTYQDGEVVLNLCEVGEEIQLSAKWEYVPNYGSYTITYHSNNGEGKTTTQTVVNNSTNLLANPFSAPEYKVFDCWSTTESDWGYNYQEGAKAPYESNGFKLNLYARWKWADNVVVIDSVLTNWSSYIGKTKDYVFVLEENVYWDYPIGTPESPFEGVFLGNGYTIDCSNLSDKKSTQDGKKYGGLFGYIGKSGIVKDVHVKGRVSGEWVGTFASVNLGLIENCSSSATVKPTERDYYDSWNYTRNTLGVAGLVASNGGKILNCVFNGSISKGDYASFSSATALKIAGLCVENSYNYAESGTIENCLFFGDLYVSNAYSGSLQMSADAIAFASYGKTTNTYYTAESMADVSCGWGNAANATSVAKARVAEKDFYTDVLGWSENDWDFSQLGQTRPGSSSYECPKPKKVV